MVLPFFRATALSILERGSTLSRFLPSTISQEYMPTPRKTFLSTAVAGGENDCKDTNMDIISRLCDIVKAGSDWDTLSSHMGSSKLTHLHIDQVLLCFSSSKFNSPSPSPVDVKSALKFFQWARKRQRIEHSLQSYSITVNMLVGAKMWMHARVLMDTLVYKQSHSQGNIFQEILNVYNSTSSSPAVFDLLIQAYAKARMFGQALRVCHLMKGHGFVPTHWTWNTLLRVVQKSHQTKMVWEIYEQMLGSRKYPNKITVSILVGALCKEGILQETLDFTDKIQKERCPDIAVVNTAFVRSVMDQGRVEEGSILLKRMLNKSLIPSKFAYSLIIYGHTKVGELEQALELHKEMAMKGLNASDFTYTALIGCYCSKGRVDEARELLKEMREQGLKPYDLTYNLLIQGCCQTGGLREEVIDLQKEMLEKGFLPSASATNDLISHLCKVGGGDMANHMLTTLLEKDFSPTEVTYNSLIEGYCKEGKAGKVFKLYYEMKYRNIAPSKQTFSLIFKCLCIKQKFNQVEILLKEMSERGFIANSLIYTTLIKGMCMRGKTEMALQLFDEITNDDSDSESHIYTILIKEICRQGKSQNVNEVLDRIEKFILKASVNDIQNGP